MALLLIVPFSLSFLFIFRWFARLQNIGLLALRRWPCMSGGTLELYASVESIGACLLCTLVVLAFQGLVSTAMIPLSTS